MKTNHIRLRDIITLSMSSALNLTMRTGTIALGVATLVRHAVGAAKRTHAGAAGNRCGAKNVGVTWCRRGQMVVISCLVMFHVF